MAKPKKPAAAVPAQTLEKLEAAFQAERFDAALAIAEEALLTAPDSVELLRARAIALTTMERDEEAHEAFAAALQLGPNDVELLIDAVAFLVEVLPDDHQAQEDGYELAQRGAKLARKEGDLDTTMEFLLLGAKACLGGGHAKEALALLDQAEEIHPDDVAVAVERGLALLELHRHDEARKQFEKAVALDPADGWADQYLGILAERSGDELSAKRHFDAARRKSPDEFGKPVALSTDDFDKAVQSAIAKLPPRAKKYLQNVTIEVQHIPADEDLVGNEPPLSPLSLGMFRGTPITERLSSEVWSQFPSAIILYQRNLERMCRTKDELHEQIGVTLLHEVGHFLGLDEDELYERGLD